MGMDVYGKREGTFFRANVWSWRPIWALTRDLAPPNIVTEELYRKGGYNDGAGLDAVDTHRLAAVLRAALNLGEVAREINRRNAEADALPLEPCPYCQGTGTRRDAIGVSLGFDKRGWCNACDGDGKRKSFTAWYRVSIEHFVEWIEFLETCDGFEIW